MNETEFGHYIRRNLINNHGGRVTKIHGHAMQRSGISDFLVNAPFFSGWVELKVGRSMPTPIQVQFIEEQRKFGIMAFCLRHRNGMVELIEDGGVYESWEWSECMNNPKPIFQEVLDFHVRLEGLVGSVAIQFLRLTGWC